MTRGRAVALAVAACVAAAAALAATGVLPNPFAVPKPKVADGRAPGWQNPFHVPEHVAKPPQPRAARPGWSDPFQIPSDLVKPPLPADVLPGWEAAAARDAAKPPIDPGAQARAAAREARVQDFLRVSGFPANPDSDVGRFRFDLALRQRIASARANGEFTVHANSRDGSLALFDVESIKAALGAPVVPDLQYEFALLRPGGNALLCGRHREHGAACFRAGGEVSLADGMLMNYTGTMHFLNSIGSTPQTIYGTPPPGTAAVRGEFPDGTRATLWYDARPSAIATDVPWLGFGVGLFKDYRSRSNRIAREILLEGVDVDGGDVALRLLSVARSERSFDTGGYRQITAFNAGALREADALARMLSVEAAGEARAIQDALDACPRGQAGRDCRAALRERKKALEQARRDQVLDWARRHGLPVDD